MRVAGQQHDRGGAAVGRLGQPDPDAVPLGQLAHHVEPEPGGAGQLELRRIAQLLVGGRALLLGHAQAAVLDLDREPVADHRAAHPDHGLRRRERHRVLDQLGQQVDDVADGPAEQRRRCRPAAP